MGIKWSKLEKNRRTTKDSFVSFNVLAPSFELPLVYYPKFQWGTRWNRIWQLQLLCHFVTNYRRTSGASDELFSQLSSSCSAQSRNLVCTDIIPLEDLLVCNTSAKYLIFFVGRCSFWQIYSATAT